MVKVGKCCSYVKQGPTAPCVHIEGLLQGYYARKLVHTERIEALDVL